MPHQRSSPRNGQAVALHNQKLGLAGTPPAWSGTASHAMRINRFTETRLIRAYLNLFLAPRAEDGSKMVSLNRVGCYDVRLVEFVDDLLADPFQLWIELYSHETESTLDSFGCDDFEAAVRVADEFIAQASRLHDEMLASQRSGHRPVRN
jgi:hypothetical protein